MIVLESTLTLESVLRLLLRAVSVPREGNAIAHCVHEYKNLGNVHSGQRSQEITFAEQGGATLFDNVQVVDLGPQTS